MKISEINEITSKIGETLHILDPGEIFIWNDECYRVLPDPNENKCDYCGAEENKHPYIYRQKMKIGKKQLIEQVVSCRKYRHRVYSEIILVQRVEIFTDSKGNQRILFKYGCQTENFNPYWRLKNLENGIWQLQN